MKHLDDIVSYNQTFHYYYTFIDSYFPQDCQTALKMEEKQQFNLFQEKKTHDS